MKNHYCTNGCGRSYLRAGIKNLPNLFRLDRFLKAMILVLAFMSFFAVDSQATHFRYGNISWKQIDANTVEFQVAMVFRSNYFGGLPIGQTFTPDLDFFHGDNTSRSIQLTVTSRSSSEGWSYAEGTFTKTYANPNGIYLAYFQSCCRISTLMNNRDQNYRVETLINLGTGNTSPVSTLPPIINLPVGVSDASFAIPASDPNGDLMSYSPTPDSQMGSGSSNPAGFSIDSSTGVATFNTVGKSVGQLYNASVTINDNNGARIAVDFLMRIVVASAPPVFVAPTPSSGSIFTISPGQLLTFDVKAEDPDPDDVVSLQVVGLPPTATMTPSLPTSGEVGAPVESSFSWTPATTGTFIVNFTAEDNNGAQANSSVTIVVDIQSCNINLSAISTDVTCVGGDDGSITLIPIGGTEPFEYSIDNGKTYQASNEFTGVSEGSYTAIIKDANGCTEETIAEVGQHNDLPVINSLTGGPTEPLDIPSAEVDFSAELTDDNLILAEWNWGDGNTSTEDNPGSNINASHTYQTAGVFTVTLTITDECGETAIESFESVIVNDPAGNGNTGNGFVTGGGWFHSPAGAYLGNLSAQGRANFGFVSKYDKDVNLPNGQTQFNFLVEKFRFHSTSYESLKVSGHQAQYKGEGRVNGEKGYGFIVTVVDGDRKSLKESDKFRIKIYELATNKIIYDNQMNDGDEVEPNIPINGGQIVIHDDKGGISITGDLETTKAYPNPLSNNGLWIEIPETNIDQMVESTIIDKDGKVMAKTAFELKADNSDRYLWQFNHQSWNKGIYVLVLQTPTGTKRIKLLK